MESLPLPGLDPLAAARGLVREHGTVFLHGQRPWHGGGHSWLLFDPVGEATWDQDGRHLSGRLDGLAPAGPGIGSQLEHLRERLAGGDSDTAPLFAGFLSYEAASALAPRHPVGPPFALPDAWFGCFDAALRIAPDEEPCLHLHDGPGTGRGRAEDLIERLHAAARVAPLPFGGATESPRPFDRDWHRDAVERIQEFLRRGDSYQVNLTGLISARTSVDPFEHFLKHSSENPVAFAAVIRIGSATITSHSPERLLQVTGDRASTAPIKGTLARSADAGLRLRASEKDQAEHRMIVDMCRNDLGRRAKTGSVHVESLMEALQVQGIEHLVSRIHAVVRPGARGALLDSMFPGASITGAPKLRTMEIIREVERCGRGPYTGSIGYLGANGDLDFNIAIRTAVWDQGHVHFGCGGGIVIDSDPDLEYEEARLKARSFFASLSAESLV